MSASGSMPSVQGLAELYLIGAGLVFVGMLIALTFSAQDAAEQSHDPPSISVSEALYLGGMAAGAVVVLAGTAMAAWAFVQAFFVGLALLAQSGVVGSGWLLLGSGLAGLGLVLSSVYVLALASTWLSLRVIPTRWQSTR